MKKRVKLLTTIASLCLAVALMAFGVYAATTATVGITSNVSFVVSDVFVDVDGSVKLAGTAVSGAAYDQSSYTGNVATEAGKTTTALADWDIPAIAFTSDKTVIEYTLSVHNASTQNYAKVTLGAVLSAITGTTVDAKYTTDNATDAKTDADYTANTEVQLEPGKTVTFVLTRTLDDLTKAIADGTESWNATLTCTNGAVYVAG